jgi:hypothetical protein
MVYQTLHGDVVYIHLCDGIMRIKHVLYYCHSTPVLSLTVLITQTLFYGLNVTLTLIFIFYSIVFLSCDPCIFSINC